MNYTLQSLLALSTLLIPQSLLLHIKVSVPPVKADGTIIFNNYSINSAKDTWNKTYHDAPLSKSLNDLSPSQHDPGGQEGDTSDA